MLLHLAFIYHVSDGPSCLKPAQAELSLKLGEPGAIRVVGQVFEEPVAQGCELLGALADLGPLCSSSSLATSSSAIRFPLLLI